MEINILAVLACAVYSMVLGSIWYGPLFGKKWMELIGVHATDKKAKKKMKQSVASLYFVQFVLVLFQIWVLAHFIKGWEDVTGVENAIWIWGAFIMPTIAASAMWTNDSKEKIWTRFLIQSGYQLILFVSFGMILGMWG